MVTLRVGGVPEHFNLPWHLAIENDHFHKKGVHVEWTDFGGGTGAMTKALRNDDADVCVLLTEGIIADIAKGNPSKIVAPYVNTPLIWGVHTGANSSLEYYGQIDQGKFAISRFGSGSHLMAIVDALQKGRDHKALDFEVIKNLDGALESLANDETQVFYWEKYTTKPYVDDGQLRRLGEYVTPWPCFMIAARDQMIDEQPEALKAMLEVIQFAAGQFMVTPNGIEMVAERYGLDLQDAQRWWHSTEWATSSLVREKMIQSVSFTLNQAGIVEDEIVYDKVCKQL